jgi:phage terminase small subunit
VGKIEFDRDSLISEYQDLQDLVQIYCDACETYNEAQENIKRNGAVVSHPRTGAPLENPYLKVRYQSSVVIERIRKTLNENPSGF